MKMNCQEADRSCRHSTARSFAVTHVGDVVSCPKELLTISNQWRDGRRTPPRRCAHSLTRRDATTGCDVADVRSARAFFAKTPGARSVPPATPGTTSRESGRVAWSGDVPKLCCSDTANCSGCSGRPEKTRLARCWLESVLSRVNHIIHAARIEVAVFHERGEY